MRILFCKVSSFAKMPNPWTGDRYNLAMVGSSDKLLDFLCEEEDDNRVSVRVLPRKERELHEGFFECEMICSALCGGADYRVHELEGLT